MIFIILQMRGEDRIFTTSMAANALITSWTVYDPVRKRLMWLKGKIKKTLSEKVHEFMRATCIKKI